MTFSELGIAAASAIPKNIKPPGARIELLVPKILKWEGGYQAMKEDRGNYLNGVLIGTNKGVTPAAYKLTFGKTPTVQMMKALTQSQFMEVLRKYYWNRWRADEILNQDIANLVVDFVWGSGAWGIRNVQRLLELKVDGIVGDKTIAAVNAYNPKVLHRIIYADRERFLKQIVANNPSQKKFYQGWMNRLRDFA